MMISFRAFSDELTKIAQEMGALPRIHRLPRDTERALESLQRRAAESKREILGHSSVAVPVKRLGDLEEWGFKKTRLAVPLPGERPGTPSWRRGQLHAHKAGDYFVFHNDSIEPQGLRNAIKHTFKEGVPAVKKRLRERSLDGMLEG